MRDAVTQDPILRRLRTELDELYGERIERVVLFGSRARGDETDESDYDIAVFLYDMKDRWRELHRLADLRLRLLGEAKVFVDIKPYPAGSHADRTSLMQEIRLDGVDL
jgi:predicted nucleotidyltransferase